MKRAIRAALISATIALPQAALAQETGGSGRFEVFGPSAEREAFFEERRKAEEERALAVLAAREAEAEAAAAEAAAAKAQAELYRGQAVGTGTFIRRCRTVGGKPGNTFTPGTAQKGPLPAVEGKPKGDVVIRCRTIPRFTRLRRPRPRTEIFLQIGPDGVTGRGRLRRPGLFIDIEKE